MRDGEWAAGNPTPCPSTLRPGGDHGHQGRAGPRPTGGSATSTLAPESSREPSASREPEGRGHPAGTAESLGVPFGRMGTERPTGRKDSWPTKHRASQPLAPVPELREQGSVAFEDVAVDFSPREWALLTPAQRRLYREVVLDTFQALASVGDQKQLSSQQDFLAEKLSNKQKIARFIRNDTWASFVGENWEEHYRGKRKKQRRYLRVSVKKSRHVGGRGPGRRLRGSLAGPGRRYECERCGNVFTHPSSLQRHIRIHTGQKPHKCAQCGKAFSRPSYLRTHEKTHSGEKPHACGVCGKAFLRPYSLTVHARVHTGEKPFACTRCGRPFSCPKSFRAHVLAHTAGKPYRCAQCGKAFRCPRSARVHARLHAGERLHECPRCGKAYGWLASLQKHVRVHDGEKPYACACCGKAFGWPSSLHKHVRAHARKTWASGAPAGARLGRPAPKPAPEPSGTCQETLACATCGKAFAQRSSLRKHTRMHTLEQSGAADNQENPLGAPGPSTQLSSEELSRRGSVQHRLRNHTGKESCQEESNEPGDVEHCCSPGHDREAGPGETKLQPHPSQLRGLVSLHHPRENLEALPEK